MDPLWPPRVVIPWAGLWETKVRVVSGGEHAVTPGPCAHPYVPSLCTPVRPLLLRRIKSTAIHKSTLAADHIVLAIITRNNKSSRSKARIILIFIYRWGFFSSGKGYLRACFTQRWLSMQNKPTSLSPKYPCPVSRTAAQLIKLHIY